MTNINSLCLYFISFVPLWLAILFIDIKNIVEQDPNLYTEKISIISIIIVLIFSIIVMLRLIKDKRKSGTEKYTIINAKMSKNLTSEYFLAYVLPLFAFDFTKWDQVIIFLIFYISLAILCVKHRYFSANIILEIFKYNFYECSIKNADGRIIEKCVISKKNLKDESIIFLKPINNEYMIEPKT
jgi:hypothetical protein